MIGENRPWPLDYWDAHWRPGTSMKDACVSTELTTSPSTRASCSVLVGIPAKSCRHSLQHCHDFFRLCMWSWVCNHNEPSKYIQQQHLKRNTIHMHLRQNLQYPCVSPVPISTRPPNSAAPAVSGWCTACMSLQRICAVYIYICVCAHPMIYLLLLFSSSTLHTSQLPHPCVE